MEMMQGTGGVLERMKFLYETGFQSDCSFLVGDGANNEEINVHRLIVGSSSPVFKAMLFGPMAERGVIKVIDISPDVFKSLLEFIYTDRTSLIDLEQACGLLYAASKYMLPDLTKQCAIYISCNVTPQSACAVLELSRSLGVPEIVPPCMKIICKNGEEILESSEMLNLSGASLSLIFQCDDLQVEDELIVYNAALRWAKNQVHPSLDESEEPTEACCSEVRTLLRSSGVLSQIRFLTMTPSQFLVGSNSPSHSGLLTSSEIRAFTAHIDPNTQECRIPLPALPTGFSTQNRPRVKIATPVRRPPGTSLRRRTVKSSQLMRRVLEKSSFVMEVNTSDNITLTGLSFCTQIPGMEEYARGRPSPPDVYTEELQIQVLTRRGEAVDILGFTHFKGILPYNCVTSIALAQPIELTRGHCYSVMVTLGRQGDYPLSILSQREFLSGIGFRFEDFAEIKDNQKFTQDLGFIVGIVFCDA